MESCAQIAGACLEQTTWLRRNLAVREEEPAITSGAKDKEGSGELISMSLSVTCECNVHQLNDLIAVKSVWIGYPHSLSMKCV